MGKDEGDMNRVKRGYRLLAALLLIYLPLSGCGRRQVEPEKGESHTGEPGQTQAVASGLIDLLGIDEDIWEAEFAVPDEQVQRVKIYASVELPDADHMSVISLRQKVLTTDKKKELARSLFDNGSIDIQDKLPLWYIESRLSELQQKLYVLESAKEDVYYSWTAEDDSEYEACKKEYAAMEALKEDDTSGGVLPLGDSESVFLGDTAGMHYVLSFHDAGFSYRAADSAPFIHDAEPVQNGRIYCQPGSVAAGKNICTMTEQEAQNQAMDFINGMGLSGYVADGIQPLKWVQYDDTRYEEWMDGYEVVLVRNINGVPLIYSDYSDLIFEYLNAKLPDTTSYLEKYGQERISIFINDTGIYQCDLMYAYELGDTLSESTTMLSYESVKRRIQSMIEAEPNPYCRTLDSDTMLYTKLKLEYMRIESDGEYALVPVWKLMGMQNGTIQYLVCINAIDGSEINIAEQFVALDGLSGK